MYQIPPLREKTKRLFLQHSNAVRTTALVRMKGLEPPRLVTPDPKSGASANSATSALLAFKPYFRQATAPVTSAQSHLF